MKSLKKLFDQPVKARFSKQNRLTVVLFLISAFLVPILDYVKVHVIPPGVDFNLRQYNIMIVIVAALTLILSIFNIYVCEKSAKKNLGSKNAFHAVTVLSVIVALMLIGTIFGHVYNFLTIPSEMFE